MNTQIILLGISGYQAAFEIISMLLVSAIIGFLTAWIYSGSVFKRKIKILESDKHELTNRIVNLDGIIVDFNHKIDYKELENEEIDLERISQRKHLLDYSSFGIATAIEKDDLKMISGIGPFIEVRLHALDIYTFRQISRFTQSDINSINDAIIYFFRSD